MQELAKFYAVPIPTYTYAQHYGMHEPKNVHSFVN